MSESLSLYRERDSPLHRLNPLTTLAVAVLCIVAAFALPMLWAPYAVFVLIVLPLSALAQVFPVLLATSLKATVALAISLLLIQGLFWPQGTPLLQLGPVTFKREGVLFAAYSAGRILAMIGSTLLLMYTTRPDALMIALDERGVPKSLSYIILATLQIAPRFQAKARTIMDAQRSRGLETEGSYRRRIGALVPLVVPLVLGSIIDVEERAMALDARAFSRQGQKTHFRVITDSSAQRIARWLLLLGMVTAVAAGVWLRRLA